MSRFNQEPDKDYAACKDCDETFPTQVEMSAHFKATMSGGSSHTASIKNQTRAERIARAVQQCADDAAYEFVNDAEKLLDEGVTEEEMSAAVRDVYIDFVDAWEQDR